MTKPRLQEDAMAEELGAVASFARTAAPPPPAESAPPDPSRQPDELPTTPPRHHDTAVPREEADAVETIRQAVRRIGKEAATYRFTAEEKKALSAIVYAYKGRGVRTSENEITRIAVNHLVEDYRANGPGSILAKVLKKLNQ
jgi:hypothetical protein